MDGIYLTSREKRLLLLMRFKKKVLPRFDVSRLYSYGLIDHTYSEKPNQYGARYPEKTFCITDLGRRWLIKWKEECFVNKVPVILSLIALIKSFWPETTDFAVSIIEALKKSPN